MTPLSSPTEWTRLFSLLLIPVLGLAGTGRSETPSSPESTPLVGPDAAKTLSYGTPVEFTPPDSTDLSAIVAETTQLSQEAGSAATWTEAHDAVQEALKASGSHRPFAEQTAAYAMLQNHFGHLSERTPSDTEVQALGEYVEMLLDNRSPESDIVYPALQILHSHWSEQRLVAAIDTTLQASRRRYMVNPKAVDAHIPDVHDEIRRANQKLVQLRNRLRAE